MQRPSHRQTHPITSDRRTAGLVSRPIFTLKRQETNSHSLPARTAWKRQASEEEFYKRTWEFHDSYRTTPQVLPAGEYKLPFNVVLEGSLPESVEGVKDASIAYMFTVEIGRKHGRDVKFQKPLRVIRVPENGAQDMVRLPLPCFLT